MVGIIDDGFDLPFLDRGSVIAAFSGVGIVVVSHLTLSLQLAECLSLSAGFGLSMGFLFLLFLPVLKTTLAGAPLA